jgi:hypothetical protein
METHLTIKHLAGYLPYGLNTKYQLFGVIGLITEQKDEVRDKKLTTDNCDFVLKFCKPILRPLSDLTKEIEVDGEKFVPIEKCGYCSLENCKDEQGNIDLISSNHVLNFIPYFCVLKLLEWHFDIYGLIDAGLAIDINTI